MKEELSMKENTKNHLICKYNSIRNKTKATCLKYHYIYNHVNVNVYFDAFDIKSVTLSIVLIAENQYYYTPLNILNTGATKEYLNQVPPQILEKILVDGRLDDFYENMESHLLKDIPYEQKYNDKIFVNTLKYTKRNDLDLPFWFCLRKTPMESSTLYKLNARADITLETLEKIQRKGYTLVRTSDPLKRKELTLILDPIDIKL